MSGSHWSQAISGMGIVGPHRIFIKLGLFLRGGAGLLISDDNKYKHFYFYYVNVLCVHFRLVFFLSFNLSLSGLPSFINNNYQKKS